MDGYCSHVLFCRGQERLIIGAMLLVPETETVEVLMVEDVRRVAQALGVSEQHVRNVQRLAKSAIERDVRNGVNVCAARALWCSEARIGDALWCRVVGTPAEKLRELLESDLPTHKELLVGG